MRRPELCTGCIRRCSSYYGKDDHCAYRMTEAEMRYKQRKMENVGFLDDCVRQACNNRFRDFKGEGSYA